MTTGDTTLSSPGQAAPAPSSAQEVHLARIESREARSHRISTSILIAIMAVLMLALVPRTSGIAQFSFLDSLSGKDLGTVKLPGLPTVLVSGILCALAAVAFAFKRSHGWIGTIAGVTVVVGLLTWAAAGASLPFQVSSQLGGTISLATPLILGALCGVMCERSGVVNVAIEGQMLTAAFAAALVGSMTQSIAAALVAAVLAGVLMGALLALFTIKYLVDEVVMGVVVNLFASGLTGFLFNQLLVTDADKYNAAPIMEPIAIPGLSRIPFLGPILFNQTVLVYIGFLCIALVWFLLWRTRWGLRISTLR